MPKQNVALELFYDGAWHDITDLTYVRDALTMQRGDGDESAAPRPASTTGTLDNRTEAMNPRNPMSPLWGKIGRYTPLRVSVDGDVRNVTEVNSWQPARRLGYTRGAGNGGYETGVESGGLLYGLAQSSDPARSAQYRQGVSYASSVGYWPGEDGSDATQLSTAYATGTPGQVPFAALASPGGGAIEAFATTQDGPVGSDKLWQISTKGQTFFGPIVEVSGRFAASTATDGWQFGWETKLGQPLPTAGNTIFMMEVFLQTGAFWTLNTGDTFYRISVNDPVAGVQLDWDVGHGDTPPTDWVMFALLVELSGGTVTWHLYWWDRAGNGLFTTDSYSASTVAAMYSWRLFSLDNNAGSWFGHIIGLQGHTEELTSTERVRAWAGWIGETAGDRFLRLMGEGLTVGVPLAATLVGDADLTTPMGIQASAPFGEVLREVRDTEDGLLFDTRDEIGLTLRTRVDRYNQVPALELDYAAGHVSAPLAEVVDVLDLHDDITVKQRNGGEYNVKAADASQQQTVNVSVPDEAYYLPLLGGWWLNRGTVDETRYPTIIVNLVANPDLVAAASAADIGDRLTLTGVEYDTADLYVIGIREVDGSHSRALAFTCKPYRMFDPARWVTAGATPTADMKRYESRTSTLNAAYDKTVGTMVVTFTDRLDAWSTVSVPYDWIVEGERIRVTSMGAVTGSGPYTQTATVTRSVNDVVKIHASGEAVHMHPDQQARYAL